MHIFSSFMCAKDFRRRTSSQLKVKKQLYKDGHVRFRMMTDTENQLDSLQTPPQHKKQRVRDVSMILGEIAPYLAYDLVRVPRKWGLTCNGTCFARRAFSIPLDEQVQAPIVCDYAKRKKRLGPFQTGIQNEYRKNCRYRQGKPKSPIIFAVHTPIASYLDVSILWHSFL